MDWHLNPSLQRVYVDEVRYLHSLWHSSPKSNPSSSGTATANSTPILRHHNPATASKNKKRKRKKKRKREEMESNSLQKDVEWPLGPSPPPRPLDVTWEEAAAASTPPLPPPVPSPEDLARWAAIDLQRKASKSCVEFFRRRRSSTADGGDDAGDSKLEDEADEEEDEEDENYDSSAVEEEAFLFFILLFKKNNELLRYFEQNWEKGWFCCLVCEAIAVLGNRKRVKNYSGCLGLLQHSHGVMKTTRKSAHRAFGRAICKVMGWDASRLPSIVLDSAETRNKIFRKPEDVVASNGDGETCKGERSRMEVVPSLQEADESMIDALLTRITRHLSAYLCSMTSKLYTT